MSLKRDTRVFQRTYSVLVENEPGVLSRVAGLFSARGYNILSLAVGETHDTTMSRMTIVVEGTPTVLEQVNKQLNKLIPVISVLSMSESEMVVEELVFIKFEPDPSLAGTVERLRKEGKLVSFADQNPQSAIVRFVLSRQDEPEVLRQFEGFKVIEVCRTGEVAISRHRTFPIFEKPGEVRSSAQEAEEPLAL